METGRVAIYTRVSTPDQSLEGQEHELIEYTERRGWAISNIYRDKISGVKDSRPELNRLLQDAVRGEFSRLVVWRIDRLGRSVKHLLEILDTLNRLDIKFVSVTEAIDTSTPTGMMIFTVLGAVASFERSILVERIRLGISNAKRRGVRLGRPVLKKLTAEDIAQIRAQRLAGATIRKLASDHGTTVWTVHKLCTQSRNTV
jgi:DNA invertase Pin-like site-specific DNA recombinase